MANNLTAAQRAAFASDRLREQDFAWTVTLEKGATVEDVTAYKLSLGSTSEELFGWNGGEGDALRYPLFEFTLNNGDLRFSLGSPTSIWLGTYTGWYLTLRVDELLSTGAPVVLVPKQSFLVVDVELVGKMAIVRAQHPLAAYWSKIWKRGDRHDIDWDGNTHGVTL